MADIRKILQNPGRFSCIYEKQGFIDVITIAGAVTRDCLQEINKRLLDAMAHSNFIVVNLDSAIGVDAELISLLCMAARRANADNKQLKLGSITPEQRSAFLKMCGLNVSAIDRRECEAHCVLPDVSSVERAQGRE